MHVFCMIIFYLYKVFIAKVWIYNRSNPENDTYSELMKLFIETNQNIKKSNSNLNIKYAC